MHLPKEITTISQMKRFAKRAAKEKDVKLSLVQNEIAKKIGFNGWSHMQDELDSVPIPHKNGKITFLHTPKLSQRPQESVSNTSICISSQQFMSELVRSIQHDDLIAFRDKFTRVKTLIVLDLENFNHKSRTFSEFEQILNQRESSIITSRFSRKEILNDNNYDGISYILK